MMRRIQSTRKLSVSKWGERSSTVGELDVLRQTMKALIRESKSFENLTTLVGV